jgi:glycerol-3-phosphate acyltransferase PlsY
MSLPSSWLLAAALVTGAYLLGSISWSYLIVLLRTGRDVRQAGSGNAGATNVLRVAGKGPALAALVLDVGKGMAPVLLARHWGAAPAVVAGCAVAAVFGHIWPLFHNFRGGKGVATAAGALTMLQPVASLAVIALFFVVVAWRRFVSLASLVGAASYPLAMWMAARRGLPAREGESAVLAAILIAAAIVWRHRENVRRLLAGTERRLGRPALPGERRKA